VYGAFVEGLLVQVEGTLGRWEGVDSGRARELEGRCAMTKAHRLFTRKPPTPVRGVSINFLLGCSNDELGNYQTMREAA